MAARTTRRVYVGGVPIGGGAPVAVQSMTSTPTQDVDATLGQVMRLHEAGCEIVRVGIPSRSALDAFERICAESPLPIVADVHFDPVIACEAAARGASKLRINPGNIGDWDAVLRVVEAAGKAGIPIRVGVNAGSLHPDVADEDWPLARKLATSASTFCERIAAEGFEDLVVSVKASSVAPTVEAYRLVAEELPFPLHLGITEAGLGTAAVVKSAIGIGALLLDGIGDTVRVSLTGDPVREVEVAWEILASCDLRRRRPELIACPTCSRCGIDLADLAERVSDRLSRLDVPLKVAVMGCVVNGPGEAAEADVGIAAGQGIGVVFVRGQEVAKVPEAELEDALFTQIERLLADADARKGPG
ncbi:MAG: (E)-4-hydroxy-3-methylbut-2-enyl-diphosphate synthase [Coriobacteriia bacterium]